MTVCSVFLFVFVLFRESKKYTLLRGASVEHRTHMYTHAGRTHAPLALVPPAGSVADSFPRWKTLGEAIRMDGTEDCLLQQELLLLQRQAWVVAMLAVALKVRPG